MPKHWYSTVEILYVVAGRLDVFINSVKYELTKDDLMVINLNEVHSTQNLSINNVILVQIPYEFLKEYYEEIDNLSFNCNSTLV
nr:cupin domain-containing protein [Clostridium folliculivorans]